MVLHSIIVYVHKMNYLSMKLSIYDFVSTLYIINSNIPRTAFESSELCILST